MKSVTCVILIVVFLLEASQLCGSKKHREKAAAEESDDANDQLSADYPQRDTFPQLMLNEAVNEREDAMKAVVPRSEKESEELNDEYENVYDDYVSGNDADVSGKRVERADEVVGGGDAMQESDSDVALAESSQSVVNAAKSRGSKSSSRSRIRKQLGQVRGLDAKSQLRNARVKAPLPVYTDEQLKTVDPWYWILKSAREKGVPVGGKTQYQVQVHYSDPSFKKKPKVPEIKTLTTTDRQTKSPVTEAAAAPVTKTQTTRKQPAVTAFVPKRTTDDYHDCEQHVFES